MDVLKMDELLGVLKKSREVIQRDLSAQTKEKRQKTVENKWIEKEMVVKLLSKKLKYF